MSRLERVPVELGSLLSSSRTIQDVLVLGYVDRDQTPPRFQLFPTVIALQIATGFLVLTWNFSGRMTVHVAATTTIPEELAEEPSVEPMYATVAQNYFEENEEVLLAAASFFGAEGHDGEYLGARFEFEHGSILTVDPRNSMGMVFGSELWQEERQPASTDPDVEVVELRWAP